MPLRHYLALVSLIAATSSHAAILIDNYSSATNDRFENDPQFIMDSFNLSGVALNDGGRWLSMVSENVYITSEHFKSDSGSSVTFYAGNDPNSLTTMRMPCRSHPLTRFSSPLRFFCLPFPGADIKHS